MGSTDGGARRVVEALEMISMEAAECIERTSLISHWAGAEERGVLP